MTFSDDDPVDDFEDAPLEHDLRATSAEQLRRRRMAVVGGLLAFIVVVAGLIALVTGGGGDEAADTTSTTAAPIVITTTSTPTSSTAATTTPVATSPEVATVTADASDDTTAATDAETDGSDVTDSTATPRTFDLEQLAEPECDMTEAVEEGDSGPSVKCLQERLNEAMTDGFQLGADGKFGERTEIAVRQFQEAQDLTVDGIAGEETAEALGVWNPGAAAASSVTSTPP